MPPDPFQMMLDEIAKAYDSEQDPQGPHTAQTLRLASTPLGLDIGPRSSFDIGIRAVLATSGHPVAQTALAALERLPWGSNPVESQTENAIAAMISVATLMGPEGPILAPDVRLGLVYMQPDSFYPLHNHDADETYVIVAGQALWTAGDDVRIRYAGDMIHHPSLMPHAFRTGPEGFLALWRWSGDINTHSYAFIKDQTAEALA